MISKFNEMRSFGRGIAAELPTVAAESHELTLALGQSNTASSVRVFPPSLFEQSASATDRHDFGPRPSERAEDRW